MRPFFSSRASLPGMPLGSRVPLGLSNTLFGTPMFYGLFTVMWCQPSLTPSWLPYTPCCPVHTQICVMMPLFHSMVSETILLSLIVLNSSHLQMHLSWLCHIQFTKSSKMMAHLRYPSKYSCDRIDDGRIDIYNNCWEIIIKLVQNERYATSLNKVYHQAENFPQNVKNSY